MANPTIKCLFSAAVLASAVLGGVKVTAAAPLQYNLQPQEIARDTWLLQGKTEDFSRKNGGNIVNTAFIVTKDGVVVFDTGPSFRYGRALRQAIASVTDKPVVHVFNSHHHPDHFLGNQAFQDSTIWSLPETGKQLALHGNGFTDNMYRLVGDWMRDTEMRLPDKPISEAMMSQGLEMGAHRLQFYRFSGHTGSDLVMLDKTTGVLFASDMLFFQRMLTTPHTPGLDIWRQELDKLKAMKYRKVVPGHGPVTEGSAAIDQMRDYLSWLDQRLKKSAEQGLEMVEVINLPVDERFKGISLSQAEYRRSVVHLYPAYEDAQF
ncbi:quinoprotein relay system zinc metallohydrolase 1 [Marinobacterium jannaschii]|uniref:quinoprotein relay system zinc metallohydrolase 1 n=1 Tax=Marinobacterium jannaschii TaxID=64970 RepID=UPI000689185E|nr:quinoprotein relay system zinc metallohydrolase 1 [Marinobacterium jannaschii]